MIPECINPYPGPESFARGDARPYFGRDQETSDLTSMAVTERLLVYYAPSGAGKTSLLNMRLIPRLEDKLYEVLPTARVSGVAILPANVRNVYMYNLMLRIVPDDPQPERFAELSLSDFLWRLSTEDGKKYVYDPSDQALRRATPVSDLWPRVLILDQFEEIVTTYPTYWRHREDFFRQLDEALSSDAMLRVIMSLRSDYVQDLERYAGLLQYGLRARYQMFLMGVEDAHLAIEGPAAACGRTFEPGVAQQLVRNMSQVREQDFDGKMRSVPGETVEPIQLQVVCYQLWQSMKQAPGNKIEMKDLQRLARTAMAARTDSDQLTQRQKYELLSAFVDGALGAFYETALSNARASAAAQVDEAFLRNWFSTQLITESGTRGFMQRGHDDTGGVPETVVQALVDHHLLRSDTRGSARLVELIHDRFVEPILRFNQRWNVEQLQRDPLLRRAHEWAASAPAPVQRDPGLLLSDDELAALDLGGRTLEPAIQEFVEASQEAKKDRDLASARQQEQAAIKRVKTARRQLLVTYGLLMIAVLAFVLAASQKFRAERESAIAVDARATAEANEKAAKIAQKEAQVANQIARSLMLANQSLDTCSPEDKLLLAHAATEISSTLEISPTLLAYTALLDALDPPVPLPDGSATTGSAPDSAAAAPPGVAAPRQVPEFSNELAITGPVSPTLQAVSPSGRWLAVANAGRAIWLGEAVGASQPISISVPADRTITAAALSDDGVYVAWASCRSQPASESPTPTPTPTPTRPAKPTDTPTPAATADPSATPTESPTPTKTPDPNQPTPTGARLTDCRLAIARADEKMLTSPELTIPAPQRIVAVALRPQQIDQGAMALATGVIQTFDRAATTALASPVKDAVDVAFSSDGASLAALGKEGQVSLWAWTDAEPRNLYEPDLRASDFVALEFVQGDAWLALATVSTGTPAQAQVALWDRQTESLIHRFGLDGPTADLALSPDGSALAAALPDSTMHWPMDRARWLKLACARAGTSLSYDAWRKAFPNADREDPKEAKICGDWPLDISFARALVHEAERKLDNCRSETWDDGLALLEEAQQADPRLALDPSAHRMQVVGGQALEYLRDGDDEGARVCLALAADEPAALDRAFQAAASLVRAERLLAEGKGKDMGEVVAALDQALELRSYWPDTQVEMAQSGLAQALYSLCQQGDDPACQRAAALIDLLEEGATARGVLLNGAGPALYFQGRRGQAVTIAMNADNNAFDAFLSLEGPGGAAISDDDSGPDTNSLIANYLLPRDGIYRIAPGGYGGGGSGAYTVQFDVPEPRPIALGRAETSTTAQDSLWQFDGLAGQLVSIRMDTADANFDPSLTLYGPDATQLRSDDDSGGGWNALIMAPLPADGSYTLVAGLPDSSGPYTLTVSQSRPLPFDQPQPSTTLSNTPWAFERAGSPVIGLEITTASDALTPRLALRDASGVELPSSATSSALGQARLTAYVLPAGDRFFVQVTPEGDALPYTLTLTSLTTPPLTLDRPVTSTTQTDPIWTFSGQAGQMVDLALNSDDRLIFDPALRLLDAEGREIAYDDDSGGDLNARLAALFLPADGQYFVQPLPADSPVSYTLTVSSVTSQTIRLLQPGETVTSTLRQDTLWAFDGRIGQPIAFTASTPTGATPSLSIEGSRGETLRSPESGAMAPFLPPETGRYYLRVGGLDQTTRYNLALREHQPPEIRFGETKSSNTATDELWRFRGRAGQVVDIRLTGWSSGGSFDPYLTLLAADGTELAFNDDISSGDWNARIAAFLLPETGDYFIRAGRPGSTAPYQLSLTSRSPTAARLGATMLTQESAAFTLSMPPGFVSIAVAPAADAVAPAAELSLMGPGDIALASQASAILARLDAAGVYTVGVSFPADGQSRSVAMLPIAATPRPLDMTQSNQGRLPAGGADLWTLDGDAAQAVRVTASGAGFTPKLELYAPDGGRLAVGQQNGELLAALPAAGDSLLAVRGPTVQASGPYTLTIQPMDATPGPQACTGSSNTADYLPVQQGSRVVLGRHRPVNGEENWDSTMDAYVGQQARVTYLTGSDWVGCPQVQVDIDQGRFSWRVRDLLVLD